MVTMVAMVNITLLSRLLVLFALLTSVSAFWRMECRGTLGLGRIDPLANYGVPAAHAHTLFGAQNLDFTSTPETISSSSCTSCKVDEDKSNYWTPLLYFMEDDGTTTQVETVGGMLAYYLLYGENITAFPSGFQMISGDSNRRNFSLTVPDKEKSLWTSEDTTQSALAQKAVGFNCLNYATSPEASLYRHTMPNKTYVDDNCPDGLRLELMFPSCWNGKDVDSDNHKDHVAFPDQVMTGTCPEGFDTRVPSLFFETIYDTAAFSDKSGQFVLANGDPVGTGYHGDFMMGWDVDFLQQAVDTCTDDSGEVEACSLFTIQSDGDASECTLDVPSAIADEDVKGPRQGLPGSVKVVYGPAPASTDENGSDAGASSAVATTPGSSQTVVGYSSATAAVTNNYGGGVFAQVSADTADEASVETSSTSPSPSTTSTSSSAPSPTTTPPPDVSQADERVLYTSVYTSDGQEVHLLMVEEDVTVTVTASTTTTTSVAQPEERHLHQHQHRHLRYRHGFF